MATPRAHSAQHRAVLKVFAQFGLPIRVTIFQRLASAPMTAGELARELPITRTAVVQHLKRMEAIRLVEARTEGRRRLYSIQTEGLQPLVDWLGRYGGGALRGAVSRAPSHLDDALAALRAGKLVLLPTETVYGLAADAGNAQAVAAIYEAKGRPSFNPLIAHVADLAAAETIAVFDDKARALAETFWPGPLTIVAPVREDSGVSDLARAGLDTVAVRAPAHPTAQALLRAFGGPVVAPSANRSGRPSPTTFTDAVEETGEAAAAALDGGPCTVGLESTVVACLGGPVKLLRPGGLERAAIEAVVGPLKDAETDAKRSPGRLALHYAPDAPVRLGATGPAQGEVFLAFGPSTAASPGSINVINLSETGDLREAAANLFSFLRAADRLKPTAIAVASIPETGLGEAINDRLKRAAGFVG